jgi:ParB family chromosome partitioning protein
LAALLGEADQAVELPALAEAKAPDFNGPGLRRVPIEHLAPSPLQPRRRFDEAELDALARSLADKGLLQPLIARPRADAPGQLEIVAGERRWRAAQRAGLDELPVLVRELGDREVLEIALVENLQRADLNPLEEAQAFRRLAEELGHSHEEIAELIGRSRSHVANTLRLLALPESVRLLVEDGRLTAGHARALLAAPDPAALASLVVSRGLSVRETEALVRRETTAAARPDRRHGRAADPDLVDLERRLAGRLGLEVAIRPRRGGGTLEIRYRDLDQLDALLARLPGDKS